MSSQFSKCYLNSLVDFAAWRGKILTPRNTPAVDKYEFVILDNSDSAFMNLSNRSRSECRNVDNDFSLYPNLLSGCSSLRHLLYGCLPLHFSQSNTEGHAILWGDGP